MDEIKPWTETELKDWAKFWEGDLGKVYLQKLENTKQLILNTILDATDKEMLSNLAGRAAGIALVIQDIKDGIVASKRKEVKEKK